MKKKQLYVTKQERKDSFMELLAEWELIDANMEWQDDALCQEYKDKDYWFSCNRTQIKKAQDICAQCLVKQECLDWSLTNFLTYGVWGGKTASERMWLMGLDDRRDTLTLKKRAIQNREGVK